MKHEKEGGRGIYEGTVWTDSTSPLRNRRRFLTNVFLAPPHDKGLYDKLIFTYLFVCEGLSNDDVGVARGTALSGDMVGSWF